MAGNERKRQQKLMKKAAARKQRLQSQKRGGTTALDAMSEARQMALAEQAPIRECLIPTGLFEMGIGNVVVSRRIGSDRIAVSAFCVDVYCLGIKNAFFRTLSECDYDELLRRFQLDSPYEPITPECARKLVEGAEAYACDLGFSPHPDYALSRRIFGGIDPEACSTRFEFGKDGKPFYVSGPHESPARAKRIVDSLAARLEPNGFHYTVLVGSSSDLFPEGDEFLDEIEFLDAGDEDLEGDEKADSNDRAPQAPEQTDQDASPGGGARGLLSRFGLGFPKRRDPG